MTYQLVVTINDLRNMLDYLDHQPGDNVAAALRRKINAKIKSIGSSSSGGRKKYYRRRY